MDATQPRLIYLDTDTVIMGDLGELQDRSVFLFFGGGKEMKVREILFLDMFALFQLLSS